MKWLAKPIQVLQLLRRYWHLVEAAEIGISRYRKAKGEDAKVVS
jgi:hypothetical protein